MLKKVTILALLILAAAGCTPPETPPEDIHPLATIIMENGSRIEIELYPEHAPNTVRNFIELVEAGFYDGLIFHRVIPNYMIQGGCPLGNGFGDPGYSIRGEFSANEIDNELSHDAGTISMARLPDDFDSAGSQFFITVCDRHDLDNDYAAFGKAISGLEIIEEISLAPKDLDDMPLEPQRIKQVTVDTFGVKYSPATKIGR